MAEFGKMELTSADVVASAPHSEFLHQAGAETEAIPSARIEQLGASPDYSKLQQDVGESEGGMAFPEAFALVPCRGIKTSMGVATYKNIESSDASRYLPSDEQIRRQVEIAEREFIQGLAEHVTSEVKNPESEA